MTFITLKSLQKSSQFLKRTRAEAALTKIRECAAKKGKDKLTASQINAEIHVARKVRRGADHRQHKTFSQ